MGVDKVNIIITMAGNSSRFKAAGFSKPKYELLVKGKPMFQWALSSLENFFQIGYFMFVAKVGSKQFIKEQCELLGIINFHIIEIDYVTRGQASTALLAVERLSEEVPIIIYNIDTYIIEDLSKEIPENCKGWIPVFSAKGEQWSFVQIDQNKSVSKIVEKVRISEWATIGLYYFSSAQLFKQSFNAIYNATSIDGETYIAPMYQHVIDNCGHVMAEVLDSNKVVPLGTPLEVMAFDNQFFEVNKNGR